MVPLQPLGCRPQPSRTLTSFLLSVVGEVPGGTQRRAAALHSIEDIHIFEHVKNKVRNNFIVFFLYINYDMFTRKYFNPLYLSILVPSNAKVYHYDLQVVLMHLLTLRGESTRPSVTPVLVGTRCSMKRHTLSRPL